MNDSPKVAAPIREPDIRKAINNLSEISERLLNKAHDLLGRQKYAMRLEPSIEDRKSSVSECPMSGEIYASIDILRDTLDTIDAMIDCTEF